MDEMNLTKFDHCDYSSTGNGKKVAVDVVFPLAASAAQHVQNMMDLMGVTLGELA